MDFLLESKKLIDAARQAMARQDGASNCRAGELASVCIAPAKECDAFASTPTDGSIHFEHQSH
jgi:hypothetical protein